MPSQPSHSPPQPRSTSPSAPGRTSAAAAPPVSEYAPSTGALGMGAAAICAASELLLSTILRSRRSVFA
jgi:hypothetical protein